MDGIGILIGDLDAEFLRWLLASVMRRTVQRRRHLWSCWEESHLLDGHYDLNRVETVKTQVICKVSSPLDLFTQY